MQQSSTGAFLWFTLRWRANKDAFCLYLWCCSIRRDRCLHNIFLIGLLNLCRGLLTLLTLLGAAGGRGRWWAAQGNRPLCVCGGFFFFSLLFFFSSRPHLALAERHLYQRFAWPLAPDLVAVETVEALGVQSRAAQRLTHLQQVMVQAGTRASVHRSELSSALLRLLLLFLSFLFITV